MDQPILINVENVSKRFSRSLKHSLWYGIKDIGQELLGRSKETDQLRLAEFWALRDISFRIRRGESVGLMGHNGAGKTTLLKLINGLIKPSHGKISVTGSVRALIALGAGFNPILTGRENILISGAVLGFSDSEMKDRFDEIVAFSELEEFIDTPVQSYSSGMLARLGFSVAIHTWPDILLIDEVLAVGDLNFAIKCYRKISEFRNQGGLIILVSHNPYAIRTNCDRAIWLEHGEIQRDGEVNDVCGAYEQFVARANTMPGEQHITDDAIKDIDVIHPASIHSGEPFDVEIKLKSRRRIEAPIIAVSIMNVSGQNLISNVSPAENIVSSFDRETMIRVKYDSMNLIRGVYYISLVLAEKHMNNQLAALINCSRFEVQTDVEDFGIGMFRLDPHWESLNDGVVGEIGADK